jgi:Fur family ferric uptake transcriptional regulator
MTKVRLLRLPDEASPVAPPHEKAEKFREFIREHGLKSTRQRDEIANWFFHHKGHLSAEQIYRDVKQEVPGIGFSTVYRTMKLLVEAGLVSERHFGDGEATYENVHGHHDHCICTSCGKITEFEDERIEALQRAVAEKQGFELTSHKMELYGLCSSCRTTSRDN